MILLSTNPKLFIHAVYSHYESLSRLAQLSKKLYPVLDEEVVYSVLRQYNQTDTVSEYDVLSNLLSKGVLLKDMEEGISIQPDVLTFLLSINNETTLELAGIIKLRFKEIELALDSISTLAWDSDDIRNFARRVDSAFKGILKQLESDQKAIHDIATRSKLAYGSTLKQVYSEILEACAIHIDPLLALIDAREGNEFQSCITRTIKVLDSAIQYIDSQPCANDRLKRLVNSAIFSTRAVSKNGRPILVDCGDTLFPLRDTIVAQNKTQQAVSYILGEINKRGLHRALKAVPNLPVTFRTDVQTTLDVSRQTLNAILPLLEFKTKSVTFPPDVGPDSITTTPDIIDMDIIYEALKDSLPVSDLLQWVSVYNTTWEDYTKLKVYHDLMTEFGEKIVISDAKTEVRLRDITSTHNTHIFQDNEGLVNV